MGCDSPNECRRLNARRENNETNGNYTFIGNNKLLCLSHAHDFFHYASTFIFKQEIEADTIH